ncbi:MAG: single-stranded-DNA-specific exonuclease RecJ [Lachnospiraceae bacterium]|nr:single-stranded-DNA-specific exonuclease RecJ [Lachnospiraceae bacterium]
MRDKKWVVLAKKADFKEIADKYGIDQVTARLIRNRDITDDNEINMFLNANVEDLYSPKLLPDIDNGVEIILSKIKEKKHIRIIGDYDIDGVTSTYILQYAIKVLGGEVSFVIPDRIEDGYGLNKRLIENAIEDKVDTILTCDNGISAVEEIRYAKDNGLSVVVTDHHNQPFIFAGEEKQYVTVDADAVIDPKVITSTYPFPEICGAFVAFKFVQELFTKAGLSKEDIERHFNHLSMYAAIGTIGDIMELRSENRIIVKHGLKLLRKTDNISLNALIDACKLKKENIGPYHIGFVLGPCINASGRLETAEQALNLLISNDEEECKRLALRLVELNAERKALTEEYKDKACELIDTTDLNDDNVLVVPLYDCHESIAGIIAGRIREKYNKPVLVVTKTKEGLKGSGRSIPAYNMFDEMSKVKELFTKFGGHAMAAGFSLTEENLPKLRKALNDNESLTEEDLTEVLRLDMQLPPEYLTYDFIREIDRLEPYGNGNPKPVFGEKNMTVMSLKVLGNERKVIKMMLKTKRGNKFEAISFEDVENVRAFMAMRYDEVMVEDLFAGRMTGIKLTIAYEPSINEYNGRKTIQLTIKDMKHAD